MLMLKTQESQPATKNTKKNVSVVLLLVLVLVVVGVGVGVVRL